MSKKTPDKESPASKENDESNWAHDIENRDYYYDDSTGYEVYDPEKDDDENESDNEKRPE